MSLYDQIQTAKSFVQNKIDGVPQVAVVLGSGLGGFAAEVLRPIRIPYADIPNFPTSSVSGHRGELVVGTLDGIPIAVMSGRIHFYEGYTLASVTLPVRILSALGVGKLIVTNAAGGVNPDFTPGTLMLIRDHINLTGQNPLIGENDDRLGPRFPDLSDPYCASGRSALHAAGRALGIRLREGIYCGVTGPSYETPAEIRMMRTLGADAVGMSTVPEVIVARHAGMNVAGISLITNAAAGLSETPLSHDEVKSMGEAKKPQVISLLRESIAKFASI